MKKIKIFVFIILSLFLFANTTLFADTTITYTGDNEILGLWYYDDGLWTQVDLTSDSGLTDWEITDSHQIPDTWDQIVWQVVNSDEINWEQTADGQYIPNEGNPGAFLGQVDGLLSSPIWEVALIEGDITVPTDISTLTLTWYDATEYGANNSSTLWYNLNGGPISGIDGSAQWIWWPVNFNNSGAPWYDDSVFIRVTNPVPEPATMLLLGSGLLGFGLLRRKFRK